jgi:phosphoribosyl 1,2-cyclic phosphate phosphodiesterase
VPRLPATPDLRGQFLLLGTGTSVGVPVIGCDCPVCRSENPRNQRLRCAAAVGLPEGVLLIDTPPDLRTQLLRACIGRVHAVAFTHEHADHLYGLDDLRLFQFYLGHPVPVYCERAVEHRIRQVYDYAFSPQEPTHPGAAPQLEFRTIATAPFQVLGATVTPIRLNHGPRFQVLGFRIGNLAYCTDTDAIPDESWPLLSGLETLILDALRHKPHPTHFSLPQAIEVARRIGATQTYFTHVSHDLDYETTNAHLPHGMALAYDGLTLRWEPRLADQANGQA